MRRLRLDFQRKPRYFGGMLLLLIAVLMAGRLVADYRAAADAIEHAEAVLARLERQGGFEAPRPAKADTAPREAEIERANEVIAQLTLPWGRLFAVLEEANGKDVALLSIQPEKDKGLLAIDGEAKDIPALLDYMRRLNDSKLLRDVDLLSHQIQQQDPQKPVHFNLSAKWIVD